MGGWRMRIKSVGLVLGYGEKNGVLHEQFRKRLDAAALSLKSGEVEFLYILCGVPTREYENSPSAPMCVIASRYLRRTHGIHSRDILTHPAAYTTHGELHELITRLEPRGVTVRPIVFTSNYHIPRAKYLARRIKEGLVTEFRGVDSGSVVDKLLEPIKFIKAATVPAMLSSWRK